MANYYKWSGLLGYSFNRINKPPIFQIQSKWSKYFWRWLIRDCVNYKSSSMYVWPNKMFSWLYFHCGLIFVHKVNQFGSVIKLPWHIIEEVYCRRMWSKGGRWNDLVHSVHISVHSHWRNVAGVISNVSFDIVMCTVWVQGRKESVKVVKVRVLLTKCWQSWDFYY